MQTPFDQAASLEYTKARQEFVTGLLSDARQETELISAVDVGCGVGYFSKFLAEKGFKVLGLDGRQENISEARIRHPEVSFSVASAEEIQSAELGKFDLVLCFGLLYHLENPFRAIRNLYALTEKILLVESMCAPGSEPCLQFLDEYRTQDQGMNYVAFYPTESCLIKMLYRAGFPFVYGFKSFPKHPTFYDSAFRFRERTMLLASHEPLKIASLQVLPEPTRAWDIWPTRQAVWRSRLLRLPNLLWNFVTHPSKSIRGSMQR
jgi:SAM-dependent methyltransferase